MRMSNKASISSSTTLMINYHLINRNALCSYESYLKEISCVYIVIQLNNMLLWVHKWSYKDFVAILDLNRPYGPDISVTDQCYDKKALWNLNVMACLLLFFQFTPLTWRFQKLFECNRPRCTFCDWQSPNKCPEGVFMPENSNCQL